MVTDEERIKLQHRYEPLAVMMDLADAQESFQDERRQSQRALLDCFLLTLTPVQYKLFHKYMDGIFVQMMIIEETSYYEGVNRTVDYINEKEP